MTRIKLTTSIAGGNFSYAPGEEVDWPSDAEAQRLVASGQAVLVEPEPETGGEDDGEGETADQNKSGETTDGRGPKRPKRGGKSSAE